MGSTALSQWQSAQAQDYEAAESMLQHSRRARTASQPLASDSHASSQTYGLPAADMQQPHPGVRLPSYSHLDSQFVSPTSASSGAPFSPVNQRNLPLPDTSRGVGLPPLIYSHHVQPRPPSMTPSLRQHELSVAEDHQQTLRENPPHPANPQPPRSLHERQHGSWASSPIEEVSNRPVAQKEARDKPSWAYEKTKAGRERKRLPLACIACRRKKIRCSGEKPACKHCTRARTPCVYKVTTRKAAPRTDYMAMLDRRLRRMEERAMKVVPKDGSAETSNISRAVLKPNFPPNGHGGKKRTAEEAFGAQVEQWVKAQPHPHGYQSNKIDQNNLYKDGMEHLPSRELQEHLSEVFFDYVYGQSYHLLHKPTYMRELRNGELPPVLVLAVCAVAARFSTHPELSFKPSPPYLRGEDWAAPVREIVLKRFDEPNIIIVIVTLILGLHEFGTCQGGRSWMFSGMATRMAHALQLHREIDHDPLGNKNDKKKELSFTDREIRRRTMWACFTMDRFTASGTERPMYADEDDIKIQLPIEENKFILEIPGPTEGMFGKLYRPATSKVDQSTDIRANIGVAAYMIRAIALWGRVIKYLNLGGQEEDLHPKWSSESRFFQLRQQASDLITNLPDNLRYDTENLRIQQANNVANQFIFLHVALNQIMLFLHRFAVPVRRGPRRPEGMPDDFFGQSLLTALESANRVAALLSNALDYHVVAPFMGYCAFTSCTVLTWAYFCGAKSQQAVAIQYLAKVLSYLRVMKGYWGVLHFMARELKETYKRHRDDALNGSRKNVASTEGASGGLLQFGDWFDEFPHGVKSSPKEETSRTEVKEEPNEHNRHLQEPLKEVEDFFDMLDPPVNDILPPKSKVAPRRASQTPQRQSQHRIAEPQPESLQEQPAAPVPLPEVSQGLAQQPFVPSPSIFQTTSAPYQTAQDSTQLAQPSPGLLPQLDRQLVYGAYAGNDPTASTSASQLNALENMGSSQGLDPVSSGEGLWDQSPPLGLTPQQQQQFVMSGAEGYMADLNYSTAWFMPFNLQPSVDGYGGQIG